MHMYGLLPSLPRSHQAEEPASASLLIFSLSSTIYTKSDKTQQSTHINTPQGGVKDHRRSMGKPKSQGENLRPFLQMGTQTPTSAPSPIRHTQKNRAVIVVSKQEAVEHSSKIHCLDYSPHSSNTRL
ncbi:unnamed protein product [Ectocarpus sp. 4 AP-2014]